MLTWSTKMLNMTNISVLEKNQQVSIIIEVLSLLMLAISLKYPCINATCMTFCLFIRVKNISLIVKICNIELISLLKFQWKNFCHRHVIICLYFTKYTHVKGVNFPLSPSPSHFFSHTHTHTHRPSSEPIEYYRIVSKWLQRIRGTKKKKQWLKTKMYTQADTRMHVDMHSKNRSHSSSQEVRPLWQG